MNTNFLQSTFCPFRKIAGLILLIFVGSIQCSWTPDIQTPIHASKQGSIVLQTSKAFNIPPQHPQFLSESLVMQILQGVSEYQERGLLQELLLTATEPTPIFSQAQMNFLVPQIVAAFAQATSEELIEFQIAEDTDGTTRLSGTVTIFAPSIFFLTLKPSGSYTRKSSKIGSSSRQLLNQITLLYSEEQAVLQQEDAKRFMKLSSKDPWIAINYSALRRSEERSTQEEEGLLITPISEHHSEEIQPSTKTLQKQLQDLRNTVNEQAEHIRQLEQPPPK